MKELLDAAAETQAEMERQFNKERALMKSNVEEMRAKIKEIEDAEAMSEVKNEQLGQTMSKIKASMGRFEKTNEWVTCTADTEFSCSVKKDRQVTYNQSLSLPRRSS